MIQFSHFTSWVCACLHTAASCSDVSQPTLNRLPSIDFDGQLVCNRA